MLKFFRIWTKDIGCRVQLTHPKACTRSCWTAGSATLRTDQPLRHFSGDWRISLCSMQGSISMHQMSCKKFYLFVYPFPTCFLFQIAYYLVRLHTHIYVCVDGQIRIWQLYPSSLCSSFFFLFICHYSDARYIFIR